MAEGAEHSAFEFEGRWQDYAPIAFTNLLLTIVTLGIYRFWAKARTRRYLWSHTRFIDDHLEWTGTGMEMFKGAILALVLVLVPLAIVNFTAQALILHGAPALGGLLFVAQIAAISYLVGVARFRSLRYRLSRTFWRGVRGGSEDQGLGYGWSYIWKNFVGSFALGLMIPWAMVDLWNERWNKMSFGPHRFESIGGTAGLMRRFLGFYLLPVLLLIFAGVMYAVFGEDPQRFGGQSAPLLPLLPVAVILGFYLIGGVVAVAYYAKFFRQMLNALSLHTLQFGFAASTLSWLKLLAGDVALVIGTLGLGAVFLDYRHWRFLVTHLEAYGEIAVDELTQSTTPDVRQGEGLFDALDLGAL